MRKKIMMTILVLVGMVSSVFVMNQTLHASNGPVYGSTGPVAGVISFLTRGGQATPSKSKVYFGNNAGNVSIQNAQDNASWVKGDISWEVIKKIDNNTYILMSDGVLDAQKLLFGAYTDDSTTYADTMLPERVENVNKSLTDLEKGVVATAPANASGTGEPYVFTPSNDQIKDGGTFGMSTNDRIFTLHIPGMSTSLGGVGAYYGMYFTSTPYPLAETHSGTKMWYAVYNASVRNGICDALGSLSGNVVGVRPAVALDADKIAFAIEPMNFVATSKITKINNDQDTDPTQPGKHVLKLRAIDDRIKVTLDQSNIGRIVTGQKLELSYSNATTGDDLYVSALISNAEGELLYYQMLEKSNGANNFSIDTTGMALNQPLYIQLVNERVTSDSRTTSSSALTPKQEFTIVNPHVISYTKAPQEGASSGVDYEYSKNVDFGDTIGTINVNEEGAIPLTYELTANGDDTYENFEIIGLDANGSSSAKSINVAVKQNAKDATGSSLKAKTYKFCINTKDSKNYPAVPIEGKTKVCSELTVKKTSLSVAFDDTNQTKKSIADAATAWNETATAAPNSGIKVTYSVSGGDAYLIDIDSDTGAITYNGNGGFGKVKIKATADDNPSNGNDNYNSAFAEKEIVIYQEVDGHVNPDGNSSDTTVPTFTASDPNIKINGTIGTIVGTLGTSASLDNSPPTYRYGIKAGEGDANFFSVDASSGVIKTTANLGVKSYHITVTVSDSWSTKEIPVTINVGVAAPENLQFYETTAAINMITQKSVKVTDTGVSVYATVKGSTNNNPVTYKIKDGSTNIITINPNTGAVTMHGVGTVTIVAEKKGATGQGDAQAELTFTVTAGAQNFIYTDNAGNELPKSGTAYSAYVEQYEKAKTFQLYTAGNPTGSTVSYQLKAGSPTDVISVDASGLVTILNATISPSQIGRVIVEATSHDPSGNYSDKTIELPINITKASQTISFKEVTYAANGKGSVAPIINEQDISSNEGGASVSDTSYYVSVDTSITNNIAYTNDGKTIHYDYSGSEGLDIPLHVVKAGNRNYEKAEADGKLHIMSPDENILATTNMGKIVYGDHFTISSLQDDSSSTNVQYQFEVDNTTYISNPTINGNSAEFDALKYSAKTNVTIKVTRTADGETPLSKNINVQVLPKEIEITIDDQEKYKGEQNPPLTYQDFRNQLVTWNGVQDVIQANDIKLSTTAKTNSNAGDYPIKGDSNTLNKAYPNYSFSFKEGTLTVKEDNIEDDWYHLEINDGNNTAYTGEWTNQDVNIISDHQEYIHLSFDQSTWNPNQVTISREGETVQDFWMKKDSGAITKEKKEVIKIDKTAPKIKGIKAKDTNNKLQDIINKLSGGIFFKPGTAFEITTSDAKDDLKVSGTKEIAYKVYKIEQQARTGDELIKDGSLTVTNEKASITISETTGTYKVCVIPKDNVGNTNIESCHEVELKKIDVDVDGDGKPDFNDPDGDGCPDLNIKWKDPNDTDKWIVINGDRDNDGIPDLNIDSDGDGKPDLNIDTDHDGKPDLNLVILKKNEWKPARCVKAEIDDGILEEYCTGTSVKAAINVDIDHDDIPDINIDTNGNMKADFNISKDGITPSINIGNVHIPWNPRKDYTYKGFSYDTDTECKPYLNIDIDDDGKPDINIDIDGDDKPDLNIDIDGDGKADTNIDSDGDNRPDINIDLDGDGQPDFNIDTDDDNIPDIDIDSDGDGKPDLNIDTDGDSKPDEHIREITEWKPDKNVDGDILYDTMDFSKIAEPQEPNDPDEPKKPEEPNHQQSNTDVKGYYYPGDNVGGAITGDETNVVKYLFACVTAMIIIGIISYKKRNEIV